MHTQRHALFALAALVGTLAACDDHAAERDLGTSQENQSTAADDDEINKLGQDTCVPEPTEMAGLDTVTPAQVTGREILERALGRHAFTFVLDAPRENFSLMPESVGVGGELEVLYDTGKVRHVHSRFVPCTMGSCTGLGVICLDAIDVEVKVRLRSDDGAFDEIWPAMLVASDMTDPDWEQLVGPDEFLETARVESLIQLSFDNHTLVGTMKFNTVLLAGSTRERDTMTFTAHFAEGKLRGADLYGETYGRIGDAGAEDAVAFATSGVIYRLQPIDTAERAR